MDIFTESRVAENTPLKNYSGYVGLGFSETKIRHLPFLCLAWDDIHSREIIIWKDSRQKEVLAEMTWQSAESACQELGEELGSTCSDERGYAMIGRTPVRSMYDAVLKTYCVLLVERNIAEHQSRFYSGNWAKRFFLSVRRRLAISFFRKSRYVLYIPPIKAPIPPDLSIEALGKGLRELLGK